MAEEKKVYYVKQEVLTDYCFNIFHALGVPKEEARFVSESLVHADLVGMESHGVIRVPAYAKRIINGGNKPCCSALY